MSPPAPLRHAYVATQKDVRKAMLLWGGPMCTLCVPVTGTVPIVLRRGTHAINEMWRSGHAGVRVRPLMTPTRR